MEENCSKEHKRRYFRSSRSQSSQQQHQFQQQQQQQQQQLQRQQLQQQQQQLQQQHQFYQQLQQLHTKNRSNGFKPLNVDGQRSRNSSKLSISSGMTSFSSLDESEIFPRESSRRVIAAPRRARSAERFDGMRVTANRTPRSEHSGRNMFSNESHGIRGTRGYYPNQGIRCTPSEIESTVSLEGRMYPSYTPSITGSSPPPPYTCAVNNTMNPPSYRQAVGRLNSQSSRSHVTDQIGRNNIYYRATQSFDTGLMGSNVTPGVGVGTRNDNSGCRCPHSDSSYGMYCQCSKCQQMKKPNGPQSYEDPGLDSAYMDQAFLLNEIMTDGMTFCSIV